MSLTLWKVQLLALLMTCSLIPPVHAQWAVVDVGAIGQLIQEVQTLEQELQTARATLQQARDTYDSLRGNRGMAQLMGGVTRNYLPSDWAQMSTLLSGAAGPYAPLAVDVQSAMTNNAVLSTAQLANLAPADRQQIQSMRQLGALRQTLSRQALSNASARFASIQVLISAINGASDPKAILDLQARIGAEVGMLQNEQTKLSALDQSAQAQESVYRQQLREQAIAADGTFASRLQPSP